MQIKKLLLLSNETCFSQTKLYMLYLSYKFDNIFKLTLFTSVAIEIRKRL